MQPKLSETRAGEHMHLRMAFLATEVQKTQNIESRRRSHRRRRRPRRRTKRADRQKLLKIQSEIVLLSVVWRITNIRAQRSTALVKVVALKRKERKEQQSLSHSTSGQLQEERNTVRKDYGRNTHYSLITDGLNAKTGNGLEITMG